MKSSLTKKILFDYFDGKYTSIQRKMIEEWLNTPENKELFHQYLDEWEANHPQYNFNPDAGLTKIYKNISEVNPELQKQEVPTKQIKFTSTLNWLAAASVILVVSFLGWNRLSKPSEPSAPTYEKLISVVKQTSGELYEKENLTNYPIHINLPDKSSVVLQPGSKISYSPKQFNNSKREVVLLGEAFFEVKKNASAPFLVYSNELITKVLGTSFSVNTKSGGSEVIVKSGRVAVFLQYDINKDKKINSKSLEGLVLNANEKINVSRENYKIDRPSIVTQAYLKLPIQKLSFNFDESPATDVLETLKKAYSAQIEYNPAQLAHCKLTAHLSDEPLLEKIELICIALEASFEEVDNKIIIKSNGCK